MNITSKKTTKSGPYSVFSRLFSLLMVVLLVAQPLMVGASGIDPAELLDAALGLSDSTEKDKETTEEKDENATLGASGDVTGATIEGEALIYFLGDGEIDLMKGITAKNKDDQDITSQVTVANKDDFDATRAGVHSIRYEVRDKDENAVAEYSRPVAVVSGSLSIQAEDIQIFAGEYEHSEDCEDPTHVVEFTDDMSKMMALFHELYATDDAKNEFAAIVKVVDDGGFTLEMVEGKMVSSFEVSYAIMDGEKELATATRTISVSQIAPRGASENTLGGQNGKGSLKVTGASGYRTSMQMDTTGSGGWGDGHCTQTAMAINVGSQNFYSGNFGTRTKGTTLANSTSTVTVEHRGSTKYITRTWSNLGGIEFTWEASYTQGAGYFNHRWVMKNVGTSTSPNVRLYYGGHHNYGGGRAGYSTYNQLDQEIRTFQSAQDGLAYFKSTGQAPNSYYAGRVLANGSGGIGGTGGDSYYENVQAALNKDYNNTLNVPGNSQIHLGYYMQWTVGTIPVGQTKTITAQEGLSTAGNLMINPPTVKNVPRDVTVRHDFVIQSVYGKALTVNVSGVGTVNGAAQPAGWSFSFPNGTSYTVPANGTVTVPVDVVVPATAKDADTHNIKLTISYNDGAARTQEGNGITIVDPNQPFIEKTEVARLTNTELDVKVIYHNLAGSNATKITIYDLAGNATTVPVKTTSIPTGGVVTSINVSSLTPGQTYRIGAEVTGILGRNTGTTFTMDIKPTSMKVDPATVTLQPTHQQQITATFTPANSANKAVTYSGYDSNIVTVSASGLITAKGAGTTTVTTTSSADSTLKGTTFVTVHVPTTGITLEGENEFYLKAGTYRDVSAKITPDNATVKDTDWTTSNAAFATVAKTSAATASTQTARITGVKDGIANVTVKNKDATGKSGTFKVKVDGTAPTMTGNLVKETGSWRLIATNQPMRLTIAATDPTVQSVASGVESVYYQVVAGTIAPTFNLATAGANGWVKVGAANVNVVISGANTPNGGVDGVYTVYAVSVDNVGNHNATPQKIADSIDVDTKKPDIGVTQGTSRTIYALTGDVINLKAGVIATDKGQDVTSKLTISPTTINTTNYGVHDVTYSYTDDAGNKTTFLRYVVVFQRPTIAANTPVTVNKNEGKLTVFPQNKADARIGLTFAPVPVLKAPAAGAYPRPEFELAANWKAPTAKAEGSHITDGVLDLSKVVGNNTTVTYSASFDYGNGLGTVTTTKPVAINLGKNGTTGPEIVVPDPGIVTPPTTKPEEDKDPGLFPEVGPDPTKPGKGETEVYRINYFQNNGIVRSNGTKQNGVPTLAILEAAITTKGGVTGKSVTIDGAPLTAAALNNALGKVGQYTLVYTFTDANNNSTYFTLYLRVNSDLTSTEKPAMDVKVGSAVQVSDYQGANGATANYTNYLVKVVELIPTVTPVMQLPTTAPGTKNIEYVFAYPYQSKTLTRAFRVHGNIELTANNVDIRVNNNTDAALRTGVTASVKIAPLAVGGAVTTESLTAKVSYGTPGGDPSKVSRFNQKYAVNYTLPAAYKSTLSFDATKDRTITVHGNPEITAKDITVGKGFTPAQFGTAKDNKTIGMASSVSYHGTTTDLKTFVTVEGENGIIFGTPGRYKVTFKVTDQNAAGRPSGLTPVAVEKIIYVTIKDGNAGNGPTFLGTDDKKWLQGETITKNDVTNGVTVLDNGAENRNIAVNVTVKNASGIGISLAQMVQSHGIYTITYSAVDSLGDTGSENGKMNVFGRMQADTSAQISNYRQSSGSFKLDMSQFQAEYKDPSGKSVAVSYTSNPGMFSVSGEGNVNLSQRGEYSVNVTIKHPIFPQLDSVTMPVKVRVHGPIVITGTGDLENPIYTDNPSVNLLDGVEAEYLDYQGTPTAVPNTNISTNKPGNVFKPIQPGKENITITVKDPFPGLPNVEQDITIKINLLPVLNFRSNREIFTVGETINPTIMRQRFLPLNHYTQSFSVPTPTTVEIQYDFSGLNMNVVGTYVVKAYVEDQYGKRSNEARLTIVVEEPAPPAIVGWHQLGNMWFYFDATGTPAVGWKQVGVSWYYFDTYGVMQTGWVKVGPNQYYLNGGGIMQTGWIVVGSSWYYLNAGGIMQTGWQQVGPNWYYLNGGGIMQTGWQLIGPNWYYLNAGGIMQTGWQQIGSNWYYLNAGGIMQVGTITIGGVAHKFANNGIWQGAA